MQQKKKAIKVMAYPNVGGAGQFRTARLQLDNWKNCHNFPKEVDSALLPSAKLYTRSSYQQTLYQDKTMKGMLSHTACESKSSCYHFGRKMLPLCTNKQYIFKFEMSNNYGNEDSISMSVLYMHLINNFERNSHALRILFE